MSLILEIAFTLTAYCLGLYFGGQWMKAHMEELANAKAE